MQEMQVWSLGQEDPWSRKWQPPPVFLPGKSHGQRRLVGYNPRGHKELDMTEQFSMHTRQGIVFPNAKEKINLQSQCRFIWNSGFTCSVSNEEWWIDIFDFTQGPILSSSLHKPVAFGVSSLSPLFRNVRSLICPGIYHLAIHPPWGSVVWQKEHEFQSKP